MEEKDFSVAARHQREVAERAKALEALAKQPPFTHLPKSAVAPPLVDVPHVADLRTLLARVRRANPSRTRRALSLWENDLVEEIDRWSALADAERFLAAE